MLTPRLVRYAGLAGSVLVTVASHLGGAGSTRRPVAHLVPFFRGDRGVLLPICWTAGIALLVAAWWFGRRIVPSTRWVVVTVSLWVLPLLVSVPLGSEDAYSYVCQGWVQQAGGDPYGGGARGCPWLSSVSTTWRDSPAPYGPLFLLVAAAAVRLGGGLAGSLAGLRLAALIGVALIAVSVPVLARRAGVAPARASWLVLACPLVLVHLVSGLHNDALMVGLLVAGLAVVAAGRPGGLLAGGLLLGAAADVKATAAVVLPFAILAAMPSWSPRRPDAPPRREGPLWRNNPLWRSGTQEERDSTQSERDSTHAQRDNTQDSTSTGRDGALAARNGTSARQDGISAWRRGAAVVGGFLLAVGGFSLLSGHGFGWVDGLLRSGDTVEWTSPSTAVGIVAGRLAGVDAVPAARLAGVALLPPALALIWWWSRRHDPLLGAGLALAATLLLAPVFHPWYAIWPLAALHRDTRWLAVPCAVAAVLCLPDGYNIALGTRMQGAVLMTAGIVAAVVVAVRRTRITTPA